MENFLNRLGLAQRTAVLCGALCLLVALAVVLVSSQSSRYILQQQQLAGATQLGERVAREAAESLASGDLLSLEATLRQSLAHYQLQYLAVYDLEGREIGAAGSSLGPSNTRHRSEIIIGPDIAGELLLELAPDHTLLEQQRMSMGIFFLALLLSLFAAALAATQGQKLARRIEHLGEQLDLGDGAPGSGGDELADLEQQVSRLPLELLRAPESAPGSVSDYEEASLLYLRLDSLGDYVETLDESSILRFTEMQRKLIADTGALYGGSLSVVRQFGLLLAFSGEHSSGSPAFRAAATAWLIQAQVQQIQPKIRLRLSLSMAIAMNEAGIGSRGDIYPDLYGQHIIDELAGLTAPAPEGILVSEGVAADEDIQARCELEQAPGEMASLRGFSEPWGELLSRQAQVLGGQAGR